MENIREPKVSVVIPSYNHGKYIGRALNSVINQSFTNWEALIIDNNSTDDTDHVIKRYCDSRIKLLKIDNQGVIALSRNLGIKTAKGKWIAFLDSDDWWHTKKLEVCISAVGDNVDIIHHSLKLRTSSSQKFSFRKSRSRQLKADAFQDLLMNGNALPNSSVVVRKSALEAVGFLSEERQKIAWEDYDCWIRLAKSGFKFKYLSKSYGYYWSGGGNTSNASRAISNIDAFSKCWLSKDGIELKENIPWWCHYTLALCYQELREIDKSQAHFLHALYSTDNLGYRARILLRYLLFRTHEMVTWKSSSL